MADISKSGTYIKFEVNAWIDKNTNQIHFTTDDADLLGYGGMHITVKKGVKGDTNIRTVMRDKGIEVKDPQPQKQ